MLRNTIIALLLSILVGCGSRTETPSAKGISAIAHTWNQAGYDQGNSRNTGLVTSGGDIVATGQFPSGCHTSATMPPISPVFTPTITSGHGAPGHSILLPYTSYLQDTYGDTGLLGLWGNSDPIVPSYGSAVVTDGTASGFDDPNDPNDDAYPGRYRWLNSSGICMTIVEGYGWGIHFPQDFSAYKPSSGPLTGPVDPLYSPEDQNHSFGNLLVLSFSSAVFSSGTNIQVFRSEGNELVHSSVFVGEESPSQVQATPALGVPNDTGGPGQLFLDLFSLWSHPVNNGIYDHTLKRTRIQRVGDQYSIQVDENSPPPVVLSSIEASPGMLTGRPNLVFSSDDQRCLLSTLKYLFIFDDAHLAATEPIAAPEDPQGTPWTWSSSPTVYGAGKVLIVARRSTDQKGRVYCYDMHSRNEVWHTTEFDSASSCPCVVSGTVVGNPPEGDPPGTQYFVSTGNPANASVPSYILRFVDSSLRQSVPTTGGGNPVVIDQIGSELRLYECFGGYLHAYTIPN